MMYSSVGRRSSGGLLQIGCLQEVFYRNYTFRISWIWVRDFQEVLRRHFYGMETYLEVFYRSETFRRKYSMDIRPLGGVLSIADF